MLFRCNFLQRAFFVFFVKRGVTIKVVDGTDIVNRNEPGIVDGVLPS